MNNVVGGIASVAAVETSIDDVDLSFTIHSERAVAEIARGLAGSATTFAVDSLDLGSCEAKGNPGHALAFDNHTFYGDGCED